MQNLPKEIANLHLIIPFTNIISTPMFESNEVKSVPQVAGPLEQMAAMDHEQVLFCNDPDTGLKAIIAVHNTVLGPSLGGTRMWPYKNEAEALKDVLRLSRGMTFKSAISGLNLGGGKAVIIADPHKDKSEAMMRRFGQFVESLNGKYITAEDVGIGTRDIEYVAEETEYVAGLPESRGGGGDPSPVTAYGVYMGMKAAAKFAYGSDSLTGKRIMVQGVGNVGYNLIKLLSEEGAKIAVSDIFEARLKSVAEEYNVEVVNPDMVYDHNMDIYAPCALGATLNDDSLSRLKCGVIAGAANNQLEDENRHAAMIMDKGIVHAPDFLINAGGIINCYSEVLGYNREDAYRKTQLIYEVTRAVLEESRNNNQSTNAVAVKMAQDRINAIQIVKAKR